MPAKTCKTNGCAEPYVVKSGPYGLLCEAHRAEARTVLLHKRLPQTKRDAYVAGLRAAMTCEIAAQSIDVPLRTISWHRQQDKIFDEACAEAFDASADLFEQQLINIALGSLKAGMPQVVSLFGLLKARRPRVWMEKQQILSARDSKEPDLAELDFSKFSDEDLDRVCDLLAAAIAARGEAPLGVLPR